MTIFFFFFQLAYFQEEKEEKEEEEEEDRGWGERGKYEKENLDLIILVNYQEISHALQIQKVDNLRTFRKH